MTISKESYLQGLLSEIDRVKARGGKSVYRINEKVLDSTANYIERYFANSTEYSVEIRKCAKCKNLWDIIIMFKSIAVA